MRVVGAMHVNLWTITLLIIFVGVNAHQEIKCLVCKKAINNIISAIENEDPRKKIQVGSFRIQPDGSQKQAEVKYAGSELHLNEILETVCDTFDDYAQAKHKETGETILLNLSKEVEKLSFYDLVPDPELNRGLKSSCETLIGDYEDDILDTLRRSSSAKRDPIFHLCEELSGYCENMNDDSDSAEQHIEL